MNEKTPYQDDPIHLRLRGARLRDPRPALRARTLAAVDQELDARRASGWTFELAFTAAVLGCFLFLPMGGRSTDAPRASTPTHEVSTTHELARQIGLDADLTASLRFRETFQPENRELRAPRASARVTDTRNPSRLPTQGSQNEC